MVLTNCFHGETDGDDRKSFEEKRAGRFVVGLRSVNEWSRLFLLPQVRIDFRLLSAFKLTKVNR